VRNEGEWAEEDKRREEQDKYLSDHERRLKRERQGRVVKFLVVLGILVLFTIFILGNRDETRIDFVFVDKDIALIWVMLACLLLGVVIGFFLGRPGKQLGRDKDRDRD
jgi:uncharacterized integral membrane protein